MRNTLGKNSLRFTALFVFALFVPLTVCSAGKPEERINETRTIVPPSGESKILIAYFTWAENTVVRNPSAINVDATSSASVLVPGNTTLIARRIQQNIGGDLFSIVVTEPYSSDYDECLDRASQEKAVNARPKLTAHVSNMADYDVVFIGFPNWWYTCPMAVFTFLEGYDFNGKTVIPFCAHGTGGLASTIRDLTAKVPNSTVLKAFSISRNSMKAINANVDKWLAELDIN